MNRRNFLKSIATVCGAAVVCPVELLRPKTELEDLRVPSEAGLKRWPNYYKPKHDGVTNEQLCELIRATLKDLPPMMFEDAFSGIDIDYTLCKNNKGEYYPGLGLSV